MVAPSSARRLGAIARPIQWENCAVENRSVLHATAEVEQSASVGNMCIVSVAMGMELWRLAVGGVITMGSSAV